jgi:hypothetical protein
MLQGGSGRYGNALQAALDGGYEQVVKMLFDKGAEVNAQGGEYGNALQATSARGDEAVVKMLLDKGAKVNAQDGRYGNALEAASDGGGQDAARQGRRDQCAGWTLRQRTSGSFRRRPRGGGEDAIGIGCQVIIRDMHAWLSDWCH